MNKRFFFSIIALSMGLSFSLQAQKQTLYVKIGASGDGSSWQMAFGDLQLALKKAKKGTEIWVAEGTYFPTNGKDRGVSFEIPDAVTLYGGFAGTEKSLSERTLAGHSTILSGNIGSGDKTDNTYNVIYTKNVSAATKLDGFTITDGHADGSTDPGGRNRSGGAWYNEGSAKGSSNPSIVNCTFSNNFAKDGGAIYNNGKGGQANPSFKDCMFENNSSDLDGGAVYNDARSNGKSSPVFETCTFDTNKGNYGGAVFNYALNGEALPQFKNCQFSTNNAYVKGGAMFHLSDAALDRALFNTSVFSNNSALDHDSDDVHHYLIGSLQMAGN